MSLRATEVQKLNESMFAVYLSDGAYILVSDEDLARLLLGRREKKPEPAKPTRDTSKR
jgi:hypothetical protein